MKIVETVVSDVDERFHLDLIKLCQKYNKGDTLPRLLAIASHAVGQILAMQNQRTMTARTGIDIIQANIEAGNRRVVDDLLDETHGNA